MNREIAKNLYMAALDLENKKGHDQYIGFIKCLRKLAETDRTLRNLMKNEGLIHD